MKKMKILYTESSPNIGGQEIQAIAQLVAFRKNGHQVYLACREDSRIATEAKKQSINIINIPFRNSLHLPSFLKLASFIMMFSPDLVVCHSGHDSNIVGLVRFFLKGCNIRFYIIRQKTYLTNKIKVFSLNFLCDTVIVPSFSMQKSLLEAGCKTSIHVVPPGFDFISLLNEQKFPLPEHVKQWMTGRESYPVIVQAGMLRPEKGHRFMLSILSQMKREGYHFSWLIAGEGTDEETEKLRSAILYEEMEDCVLMCGTLSPLTPLWSIASLMVMPSSNESFGMSIVEGGFCGVPVIASNVGGIPTIIKNGYNGILLPVGDRDKWLDALYLFFNNSDKFNQYSSNARIDMEIRFDINKTIKSILSCHESIQK